ncbi:hypothetical protein HU200_035583 [Digitaria exilis]|uniref:Uncharacterized protein n=1 Tax=Digitaria exilis TaxID=1010633 RepID=A0A835EPK2_9POAL|nr:hypothetical protein HU200_035583 [Digitaria exilis]
MAAPAISEVCLEAEVRKLVLVVPGGVKEDGHEEEMRHHRRCLLERFMESFGPDRRCVSVVRKVRSHPCVLYTMKVSVKKACVFWSHRNSPRFIPNWRVPTYAIVLCRAVEHDQVEQVGHRSGGPGEPDRPAVLTCFKQADYYIHESRRERGAIEAEGSSAPRRREVAVIRGMAGGCGLTVTSHVEHLVVRLHGLLFRLAAPAVAVEIRFSERWFCLPKGWKEEGLFAEDGLHFVDIAAPLENLARKLYDMRKQEDQEMERRQSETEEEKERRLQEEEAMSKKEEEVMREREEEWKKMRKREEEERRRESAVARMTPTYPPVWDLVLGKTGRTQPAVVSMFNLTMNSKNQVVCKCIKEEGLQDMLRRALNRDYILPISKTTPPSASTLSGSSLEVLGYVESYCLLGYYGFVPWTSRFMDESGRMLSPVMMLSQSVKKVLTIIFLVDKFNILLDDGLTISGYFDSSVDIHCDDISCSELLTTDWRHHFLCQNIDGEVTIPFSTLLVQLKKKLQLQLTDEELDIYASSVIDAEVENDKFVPHHQLSESGLLPTKPKHELAEVALNDYRLLFSNPW